MNFYDYVLRDNPRASYKQNVAGTAWTDISGNNYAHNEASPLKAASIVVGNDNSLIATNAHTFNFSTGNTWKIGTELSPFTVECIVLPMISTADMAVVSHNNTPLDGIHIDSNKLYFDVTFTAGRVSAAWEYPDVNEAYVVHGVYTPNKVQLWINGDLVAETSILEDILASGFNHSSDGTAYAGASGTPSTSKIVLDGVSFYSYDLNSDQIQQHFKAARDVISMEQNVLSQGGAWCDGVDRNIYMKKVFNNTSTFYSDSMTDVSIADGQLAPALDVTTNLSLPGVWIGKFEINTNDLAAIYGIKTEWDADGAFTLQTSLDGGLTWTTATNGEMVPTSQGLNPDGKMLLLRVTFAGGIASDPAEVRKIVLTAYTDNNIYSSDNTRILQVGAKVSTSLVHNEPIENNAMPGIHFYGDSAVLTADASVPASMVRTMEVWINPKGVVSGSGGYIFDTRPYTGTAYMWLLEASTTWGWAGASAVYINGLLATSGVAAKKNEWNHIIFVFPADFNTRIAFGTGFQIAEYNLIATYPTAFTAAQALAQYKNYSKVPVASIVDSALVTAFEPASPYVLTMADWTNLPQQ